MLMDFRRLNRRMHNKSFIVDNKVAIIGGRNIADDYFDASEDNNYRDLDLLAMGRWWSRPRSAFDCLLERRGAAAGLGMATAAAMPEATCQKARADIATHVRKFADSDFAQAAMQECRTGRPPIAPASGSGARR